MPRPTLLQRGPRLETRVLHRVAQLLTKLGHLSLRTRWTRRQSGKIRHCVCDVDNVKG